jgi:hypothetical protein
MTLPASSKQSDKSNEEKSVTTAAEADLDFGLKLRTAAALSASGYSCRLNVALSAVGDVGLADVTDIDVLAIGRDVTFTPHLICASCKAGMNVGIAKELFYVRGVLDYVHGDEGVLLLGAKELSPHLRELAGTLSLLALAKDEVDSWCASLANGIKPPGYFEASAFREYEKARLAIQPSASIASFLKADYWFYRDFRNVQNLIGHLKKYGPQMDGQSSLHVTQGLDIAWHFSQTVLDLCLSVQRGGASRLTESVNSYLFGGRTSYKARKDLLANVSQLLTKTGIARPNAMPSLDPPYASALAELVVRFLERPQAAVQVPLVLQDSIWRHLGVPGRDPPVSKNELASFKLAQDLIDLLRVAADLTWVPSIGA